MTFSLNADFTYKLFAWYRTHCRDLPWRNSTNPYQIWLSEIILQQTRVAQGLPYYLRFLDKFPDVHQLANANEEEVLHLWQGLGYYSRARNLHECAKTIVSLHAGYFPDTLNDLLKLPGIGPYTAAAIASFAFGRKEAVVDGNVYRVLSRYLGLADDIASGKGQKIFREAANALISADNPGLYNQAIMEFGALQCTPGQPDCDSCPMSSDCYAFQHGMQKKLPFKSKKGQIRDRFFHYGVFQYADKIYMNPRTAKDIWQGLYDFHLLETGSLLEPEDYLQLLRAEDILAPGFLLSDVSRVWKHLLSHQKLHVQFYIIELSRPLQTARATTLGLRPFTRKMLHEIPKPVLVTRYLNDSIF